jgi:hypothetical protein
MKQKVTNWAEHSLYKMNASTADCYVFSLYRREKNKKLNWEGGWDWSKNLVDKNQTWIYFLNTKEFKKL